MLRRRNLWLIAAAALLVAAGWLLTHEPDPEQAAPERIWFPTYARHEDLERARRRELPAQVFDSGKQRPAGDPLIRALKKGGTAVVVEANALRNSPIGELLLDCFRAGKQNPLETLKRDYGLDVTKDVDRIALTDDGLVVSGSFGDAAWNEMLGPLPKSYGDEGLVYPDVKIPDGALPDGGPAESTQTIARWGDNHLVITDSREAAETLIDRLEGRGATEPAVTSDQTFGEIYGAVQVPDLAFLLPPERAQLADQLRSLSKEARIHVDATGDVAMVLELEGSDPAQLNDLAKAIASSLALWRTQALATGDQRAAQLLDFASVAPDRETAGADHHITLKLALPMAFLEKQLAWCRPDAGR
jgi:hypothetical protein